MPLRRTLLRALLTMELDLAFSQKHAAGQTEATLQAKISDDPNDVASLIDFA